MHLDTKPIGHSNKLLVNLFYIICQQLVSDIFSSICNSLYKNMILSAILNWNLYVYQQ